MSCLVSISGCTYIDQSYHVMFCLNLFLFVGRIYIYWLYHVLFCFNHRSHLHDQTSLVLFNLRSHLHDRSCLVLFNRRSHLYNWSPCVLTLSFKYVRLRATSLSLLLSHLVSSLSSLCMWQSFEPIASCTRTKFWSFLVFSIVHSLLTLAYCFCVHIPYTHDLYQKGTYL